MTDISIPNDAETTDQKEICKFLRNIVREIENGIYTAEEIVLLKHPKLYGKYLDVASRSFFLYHFLPLWEQSVRILFNGDNKPKIVDLGCGMGTSSLLFSILGANVVGVDLDEESIEICRKRKRFYQNQVGNLMLKFQKSNALSFDFQKYAPFDVVFSLFAFNMMKPHDELLKKIISNLKPKGKIVFIDGNMGSIYNRFIPDKRRPGVPTPKEVKDKLNELGCAVKLIDYHCAIPPFIFRIPILRNFAPTLEKAIKAAGLHRFLSVSYTIVAEKL